jgi:hypothetical protein
MKATNHDNRNIRTASRPDGTVKGWLVRFTVQGTLYERYFSATDSSLPAARAWRDDNQRLNTKTPGTFRADVQDYLRDAPIFEQTTPATVKTRRQQLAFLGAQTLAVGSRVLTVKEWVVEREAARAGRPVLARGRTLDDTPRHQIPIDRWAEIFAKAFAPTGRDPAEFANTSNMYRTAAHHYYKVLDRHEPRVNPIGKVTVRPRQAPSPKGQDLRVIAEILKHVPTKFGRDGRATELRLNVLAWCNIEPEQLKHLNPARDFHDDPAATYEEIIEGAITLTCPARLKGRLKIIPAPLLKFLLPRGVDAMRAYAAESAAWKTHTFSNSSLLKALKRASRQAQAALAKQGVTIDLSGMTVKQLRHSFLCAMTLATRGRVTVTGKLRVDPGVVGAAGHADATMMPIYVARIMREADRLAMADTARYLTALFAQPLKPPTLRVVRGAK